MKPTSMPQPPTIADKVRKLLSRLAEHPNAHEAAAAAAKAQQLIDEHNLSRTLLALEADAPERTGNPLRIFSGRGRPSMRARSLKAGAGSSPPQWRARTGVASTACISARAQS